MPHNVALDWSVFLCQRVIKSENEIVQSKWNRLLWLSDFGDNSIFRDSLMDKQTIAE